MSTERSNEPIPIRGDGAQGELPLSSPDGVVRWIIPLPYGDILVEEFADGRILVAGSPVEMYRDTLMKVAGNLSKTGTDG